MIVLLVFGIIALVGAGLIALLHVWTAAAILGISGIVMLLAALFRRKARPGDYRHGGTLGL